MQDKIDILISLINESGLKPSKKKLAFNIVSDIVLKYNLNEAKYQKRIKQDNNIKSDFIDYYDSVDTLLYLMNITELDIMEFNYKYVQWIRDNIENMKELTFKAIQTISLNLLFFESCYDGKLPESVKELKDFMLEPLGIKEENYTEALKVALKKFTIDHIVTDIMRIGWIKDVKGLIKKI